MSHEVDIPQVSIDFFIFFLGTILEVPVHRIAGL